MVASITLLGETFSSCKLSLLIFVRLERLLWNIFVYITKFVIVIVVAKKNSKILDLNGRKEKNYVKWIG